MSRLFPYSNFHQPSLSFTKLHPTALAYVRNAQLTVKTSILSTADLISVPLALLKSRNQKPLAPNSYRQSLYVKLLNEFLFQHLHIPPNSKQSALVYNTLYPAIMPSSKTVLTRLLQEISHWHTPLFSCPLTFIALYNTSLILKFHDFQPSHSHQSLFQPINRIHLCPIWNGTNCPIMFLIRFVQDSLIFWGNPFSSMHEFRASMYTMHGGVHDPVYCGALHSFEMCTYVRPEGRIRRLLYTE